MNSLRKASRTAEGGTLVPLLKFNNLFLLKISKNGIKQSQTSITSVFLEPDVQFKEASGREAGYLYPAFCADLWRDCIESPLWSMTM